MNNSPTSLEEPWELMNRLRLCDTSELREVLEQLRDKNDDAYELFHDIVRQYPFRRKPTQPNKPVS